MGKRYKIKELKVCKGCGHLNVDPIPKEFQACCPDGNYIPIRDYLEGSIFPEEQFEEVLVNDDDLISAIPPEDYKGTQADWHMELIQRGLWNGDPETWHGDVLIPAQTWWEILEKCEE